MVGNSALQSLQVYMRRGALLESLCFKERLVNLVSISLLILFLPCLNPCCI